MPDTIPDITIASDDWVDVYNLSSVAVGSAVQLTNKSPYPVLLQIAATKPDSDNTDGEPLDVTGVYSRLQVGVGESGLWAKSLNLNSALISVQEL